MAHNTFVTGWLYETIEILSEEVAQLGTLRQFEECLAVALTEPSADRRLGEVTNKTATRVATETAAKAVPVLWKSPSVVSVLTPKRYSLHEDSPGEPEDLYALCRRGPFDKWGPFISFSAYLACHAGEVLVSFPENASQDPSGKAHIWVWALRKETIARLYLLSFPHPKAASKHLCGKQYFVLTMKDGERVENATMGGAAMKFRTGEWGGWYHLLTVEEVSGENRALGGITREDALKASPCPLRWKSKGSSEEMNYNFVK
ncbi:hypothetical protein P7K49_015032 [Saguinus oedipus]|uniref:Uncharacterized protein n=1 Tax=Saguinus oedipus TaxID=9490 RepID=A0ABQ9VA21_SAGOE|nr:hypothetical protein P7K49_015032 [Saguinus oedipus]